jgi:hypothetical protein
MKQMGQALLESFNKALAEYKKANGNNETQVTESITYVTWSTVTVPAFLAFLREFADSYDGLGTTPTGDAAYKELREIQDRLKKAAQSQSDPAVASLIYRAVNVKLPAEPARYGPRNYPERDGAARELDQLEVEAELWLAL